MRKREKEKQLATKEGQTENCQRAFSPPSYSNSASAFSQLCLYCISQKKTLRHFAFSHKA